MQYNENNLVEYLVVKSNVSHSGSDNPLTLNFIYPLIL